MKNEILRLLETYGEMRRRSIADSLKVWTASHELTDALSNLQKEGRIKTRTFRDNANMEYYNLYRIAEG